jgi:thymidylate synthase (FAD)
MNLWNLLHFVSLRMDSHAQEEIREYARVIGHEVLARWVPTTWEAFLDYNFNAMRLSALEVELIKHLMAGDVAKASEKAASFGWLNWDERSGDWKRNRERQEFEERMRERFGLRVEWKR